MKKSHDLVRGLGLFALTASVFNCTVGGGIFRLPSSVYAIVGSASPLVYLICFMVMALVALVFIQVGSKISASGGPYAYVQPVLGPYFGFLCGVLLWALAMFAMASVANAYASFVGQAIPQLSSPLAQMITLAFTFVLLAVLNIRGVKQGAILSIILSALKIIPLLLLTFVGIPALDSTKLALPTPLPWPDLARGAMVLIFAFTGIECALIPSGEIKNPEKAVPRALFLGLFIVLFLYLGVQTVSQSVLGAALGAPGGFPLADTAEKLLGHWGAVLIKIGAVFSTLGYLSAITLSLPRSLFAFAEDGYLPKFLARVHPSHHTPANAIIVQVALAWGLAVSNQFEKLAVLSNLSAILMYILCATAAVKLGGIQKRSVWFYLAPIFATLSLSYLLTSVTVTEWMSVVAVIAVASLIYLLRKTPLRTRQNLPIA